MNKQRKILDITIGIIGLLLVVLVGIFFAFYWGIK